LASTIPHDEQLFHILALFARHPSRIKVFSFHPCSSVIHLQKVILDMILGHKIAIVYLGQCFEKEKELV
jgi:hypothetical protein